MQTQHTMRAAMTNTAASTPSTLPTATPNAFDWVGPMVVERGVGSVGVVSVGGVLLVGGVEGVLARLVIGRVMLGVPVVRGGLVVGSRGVVIGTSVPVVTFSVGSVVVFSFIPDPPEPDISMSSSIVGASVVMSGAVVISGSVVMSVVDLGSVGPVVMSVVSCVTTSTVCVHSTSSTRRRYISSRENCN